MKRRPLVTILIGAAVVLCLCVALSIALNPSRTSAPAAQPATIATTSATTSAAAPDSTQSPATKESPNGYISADNADFPWPFTKLGGRVACLNGNQIVFIADGGGAYAINGTARGAAKNSNANYKDLDEIWLDNPQSAGTKIPVQPVIEIGLKLCA